MVLTRPNPWRIPGIIPVVALSLAFIFLVQLKIFYDNTQKMNRLNGFRSAAEELTEKMHDLERSAVRSDNIIQHVAGFIRERNRHKPLLMTRLDTELIND